MSDARPIRELSFAELKEIASILRSSESLAEFSLKFGNVELSLSTQRAQAPAQFAIPDASPTSSPAPSPATLPASSPSAGPNASAVASPPQGSAVAPRGVVVKSPMVGTFYRAPEPGAAPFVKLGDRVKKGDVICLIEVMKLINSITAEQDGEIVDIMAENGAPVEFGQPLMCIEPA
jgi:acetyl-CoA carboxylase biotin carboxyl carrier protein